MFPVSLDCPLFIAPSVFSNVYALNSFVLFFVHQWLLHLLVDNYDVSNYISSITCHFHIIIFTDPSQNLKITKIQKILLFFSNCFIHVLC